MNSTQKLFYHNILKIQDLVMRYLTINIEEREVSKENLFFIISYLNRNKIVIKTIPLNRVYLN